MSSLFVFLVAAFVLANLYLFYDKFTARGAIPLERAFKDYTAWLGYVGLALGGYIAEWLRWLADVWEPLRTQFGDVFAADSFGTVIQVLSGLFLVLKLKGQQPRPVLDIPKPGAPLP